MPSLPRDPLLFGWDPAPGLLAFDLAEDGTAIRRHRRQGDGVVADRVPFSPFLLVADPLRVGDAPGLVSLTELDGPGQLRWLARFAAWSEALAARDRCRGGAAGAPVPHLCPGDPVHQYLLLAGQTSFGGLRFAHLRRLALDIEVVTSAGHEFPAADRPGDRIVAVALADTDGFRHVVRGDRLDEPELLAECSRLVRERDPDVIEGHNIFRFDLPYLDARARRHGLVLDWGRDGTVLRGRPARLSIAERTIGYQRYAVAGRHVVDTWILAQLHDAGARDLPSFGLKDLARHFGVTAAGRTYVDAAEVARELRDDPDRLMAYALDDAVETLGLSGVLAPPHFAQAQLLPFDYQACPLRGAATKIDALLLREYLHRGRAVELPRPGTAVSGGYTAILQQGVARPVLHVDVTSLYPSIILAAGLAPAADDLRIFPVLLGRLRDFRVAAKRQLGETDDPAARAHLGALQQSFKILINAFYGYLAFAGGHWNDFEAANRVTAEGREVVRRIVERLGALGATPLEVDTDGVYFVPPRGGPDADGVLAEVAAGLPAGIQLELDGRYAAMLSYKMKTYALLDAAGRLVLKGSGFRSRGLEPFQRRIIEEVVRLLLEDRPQDVKSVIDRWIADLAAHRVDVRLLARTETLQETLEEYRQRLAAGRPASAAYELAAAAGRPWLPGDQVSYYVAGRGMRGAVGERARLAAHWDATAPDENVGHYQAKALEIWARFRPFVETPGLRPYVEEPEASPQLTLF